MYRWMRCIRGGRVDRVRRLGRRMGDWVSDFCDNVRLGRLDIIMAGYIAAVYNVKKDSNLRDHITLFAVESWLLREVSQSNIF